MKKLNFLIALNLAIISTLSVSCSMENDDPDNWKNIKNCPYLSGIPGTFLEDMAIDNNNVLYFLTGETDLELLKNWPSTSSYIPMKGYLSRKINEKEGFEILAEHYGGKLCFDKNNQLFLMTYNTVYKLDDKSFDKTIIVETSGMLEFIDVDNFNNIWIGGMQTGLYKIDNNMNVTHYDVDNSILPTNSMTNIHIDKDNNIWIALWDIKGVLKINNDEWIVYPNVADQNIWSLVTDKNGHLWIGTGHFNEANPLMRFDGLKWENIIPRNDKNETVSGTIRHLRSDGNKIYLTCEHVRVFSNGGGAEFASSELLTFDGEKWNKIKTIPENEVIRDLVVDHYRNAVWVVNPNQGIFKVPIN